MSYLQRLKALDFENIPTPDTVKTAKSPSLPPYGSFGSSDIEHFQEIDTEASLATVIDVFDDRRHCRDCANLTGKGRCLAAWRGEIIASSHYHPIDDLPRRCEDYAPYPHDLDQRTGAQRWPGLHTKR